MSGDRDDGKKRFKAITGGKSAPAKAVKSRKNPIKNLAKSRIWISRPGYGAIRAPDRSSANERIRESLRKLLKELQLSENRESTKAEKRFREDLEKLLNRHKSTKEPTTE